MIASFENYILHLEGLVSREKCESIISDGVEYLDNQANFVEMTNANNPDRQDRQLYIPNAYNKNGIYEFCQEMALFSTRLYADVIPFVRDSCPVPRRAKFQKTTVGQMGFARFHIEQVGSDTDANRMLVWMLYLNDVEEGGETEFLDQRVRFKAKAGDMVVWPAGLTHPHRGNPPYSNDKYILTGWIHCASDMEYAFMERAYSENIRDLCKTFEVPDFTWK